MSNKDWAEAKKSLTLECCWTCEATISQAALEEKDYGWSVITIRGIEFFECPDCGSEEDDE